MGTINEARQAVENQWGKRIRTSASEQDILLLAAWNQRQGDNVRFGYGRGLPTQDVALAMDRVLLSLDDTGARDAAIQAARERAKLERI
jgi:hypothetical protein